MIKANGRYVAVGAAGTIVCGDSPTSLVVRTSGTSALLTGIAYGAGKYVAVGDGTILSSTDGIEWLVENPGTSGYLSDVVFGNGLFATAGPGTSILTSSNGISWTQRLTGATIGFSAIAFGGGRFVAAASGLGSSATNVFVATSSDGIAWENVPGLVPEFFSALAFGGGHFLITVRAGFPPIPKIAASPDGRTWTPYSVTTNFLQYPEITYNNGTFVIVGTFGRISQSDPIVYLRATHDGLAHLEWEGAKEGTYKIEAVDSLADTNSWQTLTTISNAPFAWTDPQSAGQSNRIYRAVLLP